MYILIKPVEGFEDKISQTKYAVLPADKRKLYVRQKSVDKQYVRNVNRFKGREAEEKLRNILNQTGISPDTINQFIDPE